MNTAAAGGDDTRHVGKVARWTADRGFGFIEPEDGAARAQPRAGSCVAPMLAACGQREEGAVRRGPARGGAQGRACVVHLARCRGAVTAHQRASRIRAGGARALHAGATYPCCT